MTYSKPEIQVLGDATHVIQHNRKTLSQQEPFKPVGTLSVDSAYDVDE